MWGSFGGWFGEMDPLFPAAQLHQVLLAHVSRSTVLAVDQNWVLALPIPSCETLSFKSVFSL